MVIVLLGVSGSGKTTVGTLLARNLGCAFYDADDFHTPENKRKMHAGIPLSDEDRWPWLARLKALIGEIVAEGRTAVVACSALHKDYRGYLWQEGVRFVYLKADFDLIQKRLAGRQGHFFDPSLLPSQFEELEEPRKALVVDAAKSPEEIVRTIRGAMPQGV
jgi:gluconokinase